jgi:uncharacterized protein (TIGR02145 family)
MLTFISCQNEDIIPKIKEVQIKSLRTAYMDEDSLDLSNLRVLLRKENGEDIYAYYDEFEEYGLTCNPVNETVLDPSITEFKVTHTESGSEVITDIIVHEKMMSDYEGNEYRVIMIGSQVWMGENLNSTYYPNGTPIPEIQDANFSGSTDDEWGNLLENDDVYYTSEDLTFGSYGKLYTWTAAMGKDTIGSNITHKTIQGVCPDGWHLPNYEEWAILRDYLDRAHTYSGTVLKSNSGWLNNGNGTDLYGFTAYPTGIMYFNNSEFDDVGTFTGWWTSIESTSYFTEGKAFHVNLASNYTQLSVDPSYNYTYKQKGLCVRCIKDEVE